MVKKGRANCSLFALFINHKHSNNYFFKLLRELSWHQSRYHIFLTLSLYVKLTQKQIDFEIWQLGLFFIIKEYGNTTFLRLFVCQYFHENPVLLPAQVIKSGDDNLTFPLSRITNVAAEHIWVSHIWKEISQGLNCGRSCINFPFLSC